MTRISGATTAAAGDYSGGDFARDWDAVRGNGDIQFAPVEIPPQAPPEPPGWLESFFNWLGHLLEPLARLFVGHWGVIGWVLAAIGIALILYGIYRLIDPASLLRKKRNVEESVWAPDQAQALQLLDEADRLAREGRFDEAVHLLLMRSVGQIAELRPDLIDPSSTAREIAALPALPGGARSAFSTIATGVERSLFAMTSLSAEDWQAARTAYADFALGYQGVRQGAVA